MTIFAEFAQFPDGTNRVASAPINGESKQLTVNDISSNYPGSEPGSQGREFAGFRR